MKDYKLGFALLFIPLFIAALMMWPDHELFTAPGDTPPVKELGVNGSVHFTYVYEGVTDNLLDKIVLSISTAGDVAFTPIDTQPYQASLPPDEKADPYTIETVTNAVQNAGVVSQYGTDNELNRKLRTIIDQSINYSGDSLGLMVAIGLYEEWEDVDFSRGDQYMIAGTGTMEADQSVGSVGAIREKLITAEKNHVDIFLIPKDESYYKDPKLSNQYTAEQVMKKEDLHFKVIPVSTLEEALNTLELLP